MEWRVYGMESVWNGECMEWRAYGIESVWNGECMECTLTVHLDIAAQFPRHIVIWNAAEKKKKN